MLEACLPFHIRNGGKGVVGVDASSEVRDKAGEVVVSAELANAVEARLPPRRLRQRFVLGAEHRTHDLQLVEHRQPLVQPEVLPRVVGDEITAPRVGHLVSDYGYLASVAREQCWGDEGEARVLHPAVGEGGREDKEVVHAPLIRAADALPCRDEFLGVCELPRRFVQRLSLAPDMGARPDAL